MMFWQPMVLECTAFHPSLQGVCTTQVNCHFFPFIYSPTPCSRVSASNMLANPSFEQVTSASSEDGAYLSIPSDTASTYLADSRSACL